MELPGTVDHEIQFIQIILFTVYRSGHSTVVNVSKLEVIVLFTGEEII